MHTLCHIDELEEPGSKGVVVNDTPLVVVKIDGAIHVYRNWCPHLGITLEYMPNQFLDLEKRHIECANHGALFEIDSGRCIVGPCHGQSLIPVPHRIEDGRILVETIPPVS